MTSAQVDDDETSDNDDVLCNKLVSLLKCLEQRAIENERFFSGANKADVIDKMFKASFADIHTQISGGIIPAVEKLYKVASCYDIDASTRANGIRSWLGSVDRLATKIIQLCEHIETKRNSVFFRRVPAAKQLKAHSDYLASTRSCLDIVHQYTEISKESIICDMNLDESIEIEDLISILSDMRLINIDAFRGRTACFHYDESIGSLASGLTVLFAAISQAHKENAASSFENEIETEPEPVKSFRHTVLSCFANTDTIAENVRWGLANSDLCQFKKFLGLGDHPMLVGSLEFLLPHVAISQVINLYSVPLTVEVKEPLSGNVSSVIVDPPSSGTGTRPTKTRLISGVLRSGQEYWLQTRLAEHQLQPVSDTIVFQVHGGGFISQSSRSQEVFLREYCNETNVPFFCVDYSLLPDDVYPRGVEEVMFAFCWMLGNMSKLGCSGQRIIALGDSAGCCLILSMCYRLLELGVRLPDGFVFIYPYTCGSFAPSPSRLLSFADPIVPIMLLLRCCFGYSGRLSESDARLFLGVADRQKSLSACNSPAANTNEYKPPRRCVSAPGILLKELAMSDEEEYQPEDENIKPSLTADFCQVPLSQVERMRASRLITLPLFADHRFTPLMAPAHVLAALRSVHIVTSTADPLLDDAVEFCRRMRKASGKCEMTILNGLPHGFMNMGVVSSSCQSGIHSVLKILKQMISSQN